MNLCENWAKVFVVKGYQVLVFGERQMNAEGDREFKLTFMTDLKRYNAGSVSFVVTFQGWFDQKRFDVQTTDHKVELALRDMITQYNQQMVNGVGQNITLDVVDD
jgi:hypothetical protein